MKKTHSNVVRIPKPPSKAFNKNRPISSLLRAQVRHFHEIERQLLLAQLTNIDTIHTENQAAEYIHKMTSKLHSAAEPKPRRKEPK